MSIGFHPAGHNNGPSMATGVRFRKLCWGKVREALLPKLPIEVIRRRLKRAKELGLDYKSYASIRATSDHDVVEFCFPPMRCVCCEIKPLLCPLIVLIKLLGLPLWSSGGGAKTADTGDDDCAAAATPWYRSGQRHHCPRFEPQLGARPAQRSCRT